MFKGLTSHTSKELRRSCQGRSPHLSAELFCAECRVDSGNMHFVLVFFATSHAVFFYPLIQQFNFKEKNEEDNMSCPFNCRIPTHAYWRIDLVIYMIWFSGCTKTPLSSPREATLTFIFLLKLYQCKSILEGKRSVSFPIPVVFNSLAFL